MVTLRKKSYFPQKTTLISVFAFLVIVSPIGAFAAERTNIKFMNPFTPTGGWAMFWSCQDRFWPDEGVSGEVLDGKGSAPVVKAVATASCEMGYTGIQAALLGIQEGMPIKIVLIGEENEGTALITIKETGIKTLKDCEGKRVGIFPYGHTSLLVQNLLKRNNVDLTKIKFTNLNPGSGTPLLMTRKIDALAGIVASQDMELLQNGFDPVVFPIKDYGYSIYAFALIINTDWEKKVGHETVLKYLRGIVKGFILLKTNVKQLVDDMVKYRPTEAGNYDLSLAEFYPRWQYRYKSEIMDKNGFGWIDKSKMERTQNVFIEAEVLKKKIDVEKYYTMEYLTDKSFSSLAMEYARAKLDPNLKAYYDKLISKRK